MREINEKERSIINDDYYDIENPESYIEYIIDRFDVLHNNMADTEYSEHFVSSILMQTNDGRLSVEISFKIPGGFNNITNRYRLFSGIWKKGEFYKGINILGKQSKKFFKALKSYGRNVYGRNKKELFNYMLFVNQIDFCSGELISRMNKELDSILSAYYENKRK